MLTLKYKTVVLALFLIADLGACAYLLANQSYNLLYLAACPILPLAVLFYCWLQRVRSAELITQNAIICIPAGKVSGGEGDIPLSKSDQAKLVIVSGFGVLAGEKIYKFNCDGIRLFSMEIDYQFISLSFGTREKQRRLKIRHGLSEKEELLAIAEKIHYETGVSPEVNKICF